jgi:hypothetical protein
MATLIQRQKALPINFGKITPVAEGPRGFTVVFDFTGAPGTQSVNLDNSSMGISSVQSVFIDNSNNASSMLLTVNGTNQKINMPPLSQGFMPVLLSGDTGVSVAVTTAGTVPIPIQFLNVQHDGLIWSAQGNVIVGTVAVSGTVTANNPTGVETDKHTNIAVGGTSVQVMAANGARKGIFIQNPTDEAGQNIAAREPLYISFGGAAGVNDGISIELQPGAAFAMNAGGVTTQAIFANAATANHRFIAWELN